MSRLSNTKSFTVRIAPELYEASAGLASRRRLSLNALIQECLANAIQVEEQREMVEAAEILGQDREACDVEYAFVAQSEVVLDDRS
jgi:hypothetical protein